MNYTFLLFCIILSLNSSLEVEYFHFFVFFVQLAVTKPNRLHKLYIIKFISDTSGGWRSTLDGSANTAGFWWGLRDWQRSSLHMRVKEWFHRRAFWSPFNKGFDLFMRTLGPCYNYVLKAQSASQKWSCWQFGFDCCFWWFFFLVLFANLFSISLGSFLLLPQSPGWGLGWLYCLIFVYFFVEFLTWVPGVSVT